MRARRSLRQSFRWAVVMTWGHRMISSGFAYVLAAILGPLEFGLVAMALAFVELTHVVLEQGLSTAIVQREQLDDEHLHSAFWLNLVWCLVLAGVTVAASGWWARANGEPELRNVIVALSGLLVIWGLMIVQMSLLTREARFRELAVCWNVAALAGGVCGLALALGGAGVWAFVAQQLVMDGVALVAMSAATRWLPRPRFSRRHARELLGFSASVFAANLGGFVNRRADTLLMGLFFGPVAVGLYRLADRIVELVLELTMRPVGLIALPHFSRLQHDPEGLRLAVTRCVRLTLVIAVPAFAIVAATSEFLLALLGDEWLRAADVLALLCIVGLVKALVYVTGPLLFATGRPLARAAILWALGVLSAVTVVGAGLWLEDAATDRQILGMAASRALLFVAAVLPVNVAVLVWFAGVRPRSLASALPAPLVSGFAAFGLVAALRWSGVLDGLSALPAVALAAGTASAAALAPLVLLEPSARSAFRSFRGRVGRRRALDGER